MAESQKYVIFNLGVWCITTSMRKPQLKQQKIPECIPFSLNEDKDLRYNYFSLLCRRKRRKKNEEKEETQEENGDVMTRYMFNIIN